MLTSLVKPSLLLCRMNRSHPWTLTTLGKPSECFLQIPVAGDDSAGVRREHGAGRAAVGAQLRGAHRGGHATDQGARSAADCPNGDQDVSSGGHCAYAATYCSAQCSYANGQASCEPCALHACGLFSGLIMQLYVNRVGELTSGDPVDSCCCADGGGHRGLPAHRVRVQQESLSPA